MARLVARALRLERSALIQTGSPQRRYCLSYLASALLWKGSVLLVVPELIQEWLLQVEIPRLQAWMGTDKAVAIGDRFVDELFQGLLITSPQSWLADRLEGQGRFPAGIPTIIDGADDLESWTRDRLTACLQPVDWDELMQRCPDQADAIRDARVRLTKAIFQHPPNPYQCCLLEKPEQEILQTLYEQLGMRNRLAIQDAKDNGSQLCELPAPIPIAWKNFWHQWQESAQLMWAAIARSQGQFSLFCGPVEVATALEKVWLQQPVVVIGEALDLERSASIYRQQLGLGDLTCIKFSPDRQRELIQLYLPDRLPMPNTPQFQEMLKQQVQMLLKIGANLNTPVILLVGDMPLKAQLGAVLAAEFGSRVQVETTKMDGNGILVSGWEFWRQHHGAFPAPQLLMIATLPIPSLEDPLVAGKVAYYKQRRQDWFRLYLLPAALRELQRAIAPVRESQGVVALLDNRVNHRSYGRQVLSALSPFARINYLDATWFSSPNSLPEDNWL
jgi:ATP-dependent DNA helicase DinG